MSIRKTFFDTAALSFSSVVRLLSQFLAIPILSRMLSPEDYGVVAMAMPFVLFAMMIADAGIGMSLVRTPISERQTWSTCFWLSVMLGAGLAVGMLVMAPFFSVLFGEPKLGPIVMALAGVVFLQSICSISGAQLQQAQRFTLLAGLEVAAVAISIGLAVFSAWQGAGAWALVIQQVALYGVRTGSNFWFSDFRPLLTFRFREVGEHIAFGRNVLSVNMVTFFTRSIDNLVIGKVLDAAAVGVYSMAFQFARLPMLLVSGPLQYVFYAKLSRVKNDVVAIRRVFLLLTRILALVIVPGMGLVAVAWRPVFTVVLSEKWMASGEIFMLVALACTIQAIMGICGMIRMVLGRTDIQLRATMETGVMWVVTLLISVQFGLQWVALAYSVVFTLYSPRTLMLTLPLIECGYGAYLLVVRVPVVVTIVGMGVFVLVQAAFDLGTIGQLITAAGLILCCMALAAGVQRKVLGEELRFMQQSGMH